jgi:Tfp pilus assembly protein PilN
MSRRRAFGDGILARMEMDAPNQVSFLPDDYLERKAQRRSNVICAALFLVVMGGIGSAFYHRETRTRELEQELAAVDAAYNEAARRIKQVQQMQTKQRQMARQAELTESLLEKVPRSFMLAELTNSMPVGVSLLDFTLESRKRAAPAAATPRAKSAFEANRSDAAAAKAPAIEVQHFDVFMRLTGIASTDVQVAQFMSSLLRSQLLRDVNLLVTEEFAVQGEKLRKFQIEMMLDPRAEVSPSAQEPKTAAVEIE